MGEQDANVAIVRSAYEAWHESKGDANVWIGLLADHVSWGSLADGRPGVEFTKPRASRDEVIGYFEGLAKDWSMNAYHVNEFVVQGARIVALCECSWTHRGTGNTVTIPKVDVLLLEQGKITQFMEFYDTQAVLAACEV